MKENEWKEVYTHKDHQSSINCVAWAPYDAGLKLAIAGADGSITILSRNNSTSHWETSQKIEAHSQGINSVAWAPYISSEELVCNQNLKLV